MEPEHKTHRARRREREGLPRRALLGYTNARKPPLERAPTGSEALVEAELFLPWSAQKLRGRIFAGCTVVEARPDAEGTVLRVRGEPEAVGRLREQLGEAGTIRARS